MRGRAPSGTASPAYGARIALARRLLQECGVLATWEITREMGKAGHVVSRLRALGEVVQIRGSTLYARPDVAAEIEAVLARHALSASEDTGS